MRRRAGCRRTHVNATVIFPYLNGEDLNSRPDCICLALGDRLPRWPIGSAAAVSSSPSRGSMMRVKPERQRKRADGTYERDDRWWQLLAIRRRPGMRTAIQRSGRGSLSWHVSKTVMPSRVRTGQILATTRSWYSQRAPSLIRASCPQALHQSWAIKYGPTHENRSAYTPSDVFETFPRPEPTQTALRQSARSSTTSAARSCSAARSG